MKIPGTRSTGRWIRQMARFRVSGETPPACLRAITVTSRSRGLREEAGFNLIEVTLAVAVVAVGLLAILGLLGGGITAGRSVGDETIASQLAADILAERRAIGYTDTSTIVEIGSLVNTTNYTDYFDAEGFDITTTSNAPYFRVVSEVKAHPVLTDTNQIAQVFITIAWPMGPSSNEVGNVTTRLYITQITRK